MVIHDPKKVVFMTDELPETVKFEVNEHFEESMAALADQTRHLVSLKKQISKAILKRKARIREPSTPLNKPSNGERDSASGLQRRKSVMFFMNAI